MFILEEPIRCELFEAATEIYDGSARDIAALLKTEIAYLVNEDQLQYEDISPRNLAGLAKLIKTGRVTHTIVKPHLHKLLHKDTDVQAYLKQHALEVVADDELLTSVIEQVLEAHPQAVRDWKAGKHKVLGFLVGQVMRRLKGRAEPRKVNQLLRQKLDQL